MTISWSDYPRIVFLLAEAIQGFSADSLNSEFHGRRSIWWCWMETSVAPRIVNDVSYATDINHVNNRSFVSRINHECCFVVQSSTGVVL